MSRKFLSLALCGVLALPVLAVAAGPLSLDEAIRHALSQNLELRAAGQQAQAADARANAARGAFLPQVGVRYMVRRSDNPLDAFADKLNTRTVDPASDFSAQALNYPSTSTVHATQLTVELPLYTGGRLVAGRREAGAFAEAARLGYERRRQITAYDTLHAYRAAQAAAYGVGIANDAVEAAREHADTTARLVRQGRIVASDRMTAELNLASAQSLREQAANRQRLALEELRLMMGLPADAALVLPPWENPATAMDGGSAGREAVSEWGFLPWTNAGAVFPPASTAVPATAEREQRALAARKDLKANEALLTASRTRITAARAAFQPQVGLVAADSWYDDNAALDNKSQSIMGVVSLNLFNGGRDWHGLSAAQRDTEQTELRLEGARQAARNEVRAAASRLHEATARRRIAGQSVDKAREAVRLVKQRYGEGRTILIDLLLAERVLLEARNEELAASLGQELSAAQLQLAEGNLTLPGDAAAQ
ncbi:MAG TPA: TolC family protein [Acidiferrobacterales bacterium]|nr:TolC family protein [Acidiferrobacterales bacterium]